MSEYNAVIIGSGAAGLMAAIRLESGGMHVALVEQSDRVGRKILATGNGRCNLLNMHLSRDKYFSRDIERAMNVLRKYPPEKLLDEFSALGLITREEDEGRVYPLSGQASSVLDVLRMAVCEAGADIFCSCAVAHIEHTRFAWQVHTCDGRLFSAANLILACGGLAQPVSPANKQQRRFDVFNYLSALGHTIYTPEPVLTPLICDMSNLRGLKGVRVHCGLTLIDTNTRRALRCEYGEALFTDYGVSGIAAMQLSRALENDRHCALLIDLLPDMSEDDVYAMLKRRVQINPNRSAEDFLIGILHRLLAMRVVRICSLTTTKPCGSMSDKDLRCLAKALKQLETAVQGVQDFKSAQVMRGGLSLSDFDDALMSRHARGLYACGEMLDVDGECGGYNLMWAWASALYVADSILSRMNTENTRRARNNGRNYDKDNRN